MKTEVFMERTLGNVVVRQSNVTEMFNVTDLVDGFNENRVAMGLTPRRLDDYWRMESTNEFLEALENQTRESTGLLEKQTSENGGLLKSIKRGKLNKGTWVAPEIFVDIAMWLNPQFKVKILKWVVDGLLNARNGSGVQYALMNLTSNLRIIHKTIHNTR